MSAASWFRRSKVPSSRTAGPKRRSPAGRIPRSRDVKRIGRGAEVLEQRALLSAAPVHWSDFSYLGDFRLPEVQGQESTFSYVGGGAADGAVMAYNPYGDDGRGSLFVRGHVYDELVSEVSIPDVAQADLPTATVLQPFGDVAPGFLWRNVDGAQMDRLSGLVVSTPPGQSSPRLFWTVREYYHVTATDVDSHGVSTLSLSNPQATGLWNIAGYDNNATAGYLGEVPASFAGQYLGGRRILTGQVGVCGDGTSSWGPAALAIQPWSDDGTFPGDGTQLEAVPLVYYPPNSSQQYPGWKHSNKVNAVQWLQLGDKQALVFSVTVGLGDEWYGDSNGRDPADPYKGFHAPPYQTELWFYSVDDLLTVVQGQMQPWEVRPYERAVLDPYFQRMQRTPGPIAFDAAGGRLFVMEPSGTTDQWGSEPIPVIHVFQGLGAGPGQNVFFLHQSVGQGIMDDHGGHPGLESQIEAAGHHLGDYSLWDWPPGGSIPTEIAALFADQNDDGQYGDLLAGIPGASESDVLMLKSCFYTLSDLEDPANLANWQQAFIGSVAPYANQHPEQKLVVMPAVPERRSSGLSAAAAARGRDWSDWLGGDFITNYTTHHNVYSFDLFDFLADPETHPTNANYQRAEYRNGDPGDSHPNDAAYSAAADAIAGYLLTTVIGGGANHAPVAGAQCVETPQDTPIAITLAASDSDGDPLSYEIVAGPASGAVELLDNVAAYTPADGWHGEDRFTFRAYDGLAYSNTATVCITVYDPDPVVAMPTGNAGGNLVVRRRDDRIQVVNRRGGRILFDEPIARLNSLAVVGEDDRADRLIVDAAAGGEFVLPGGLRFDGGSGSPVDTLTLRGTMGEDTFVLDDGSAALGGLDVQIDAVERLSVDGGRGNDTYQIAGLSTTTTLVDSRGADLLDFSQAATGVAVDVGKSGGQAQTVFDGNAHTLALRGTFENVIGTPQADVIRGNSSANQLHGGDGNDRLYGNSGNDTLYGGPGDDWLYGDAGNDRLYGESGHNALLGGAGNDRLDVLLDADAAGRNMLIGGLGSDTLQGGPGEEILIGGTTIYDNRPAALAVVMSEWSSDRSFDERTANLANGIPDPVLGLIQLTKRTSANRRGTVLNDGVRDTLFGNVGSDWLFSFANDRV